MENIQSRNEEKVEGEIKHFSRQGHKEMQAEKGVGSESVI